MSQEISQLLNRLSKQFSYSFRSIISRHRGIFFYDMMKMSRGFVISFKRGDWWEQPLLTQPKSTHHIFNIIELLLIFALCIWITRLFDVINFMPAECPVCICSLSNSEHFSFPLRLYFMDTQGTPCETQQAFRCRGGGSVQQTPDSAAGDGWSISCL